MCDACRARIDAALSEASVADVLAFEQFVEALSARQQQTIIRGLWCSEIVEDREEKGFEEGEASAEFEWRRMLEPICQELEIAVALEIAATGNPPTDSPLGRLDKAIIELRGLL